VIWTLYFSTTNTYKYWQN